MLKVGVLGASGRMGQTVVSALSQSENAKLTAAVVRAASSSYGKKLKDGLQYTSLQDTNAQNIDVLIDFSLPEALDDNLSFACENGIPIVVCTTGLDNNHQQQLMKASEDIPLLYARNTSVGIALLEQLVALASAALSTADIEIFEAHHKHKKDAPSGTAIALGEAAAKGRHQDWSTVNTGVRGDGVRQDDSIGFSVMRAGDIIGEHQVTLATEGERIELSHKVSNRNTFAQGAVNAALWLQDQKPGYYSMQDILELNKVFNQLLKQ
ncbi:4-hydroxy-tetrahydrodipicolinate reductase [Idiomarina piscisalsi]|uniref:4-hydroxy-tetrahydrodipicolinate reductase n=1 Tax=Idiomarina piscisalsi TaxID=1096243 RepID=A0ABM6LUA4_9GAMM|nr:4-hydroxy-tetrahydrodipicolinate reductase [Idiomarina piscisalsi]ASG66141.1 4-hydroxy-tetrahydrodipicolinate reductase [Idiomarina piscisalsi]